MSFLCVNHRSYLTENPNAAMFCFYNNMDNGQVAYAEQNWLKAIKFYGSAYEAAGILLQHAKYHWLKPYVNSACNLSHAMSKLGQHCSAKQLLEATQLQLKDQPQLEAAIRIAAQEIDSYAAPEPKVYFNEEGKITLALGDSNALH